MIVRGLPIIVLSMLSVCIGVSVYYFTYIGVECQLLNVTSYKCIKSDSSYTGISYRYYAQCTVLVNNITYNATSDCTDNSSNICTNCIDVHKLGHNYSCVKLKYNYDLLIDGINNYFMMSIFLVIVSVQLIGFLIADSIITYKFKQTYCFRSSNDCIKFI